MDCDREALDARIEEIEAELAELGLLRDVLNFRDEGFIEIDEGGRCYPGGTACPNTL